jgi:two-component system nitrogen regulation sensor histidine kinase NtrY
LVAGLAEKGREVADQQVTFAIGGRSATLIVTASSLAGPGGTRRGFLVVLDDVSEVVRAQQAMAWREVARRIAHEIKNPLTPIQLSTERLRKKFAERAPDVGPVLEECTRTIIQEVEGLRKLVDEFSRYARMPALQLRPSDLHVVIRQVEALYAGAHGGIVVQTSLDSALPVLQLDPDQFKRVLINLVDNAVTAIGEERQGTISISTRYRPEAGRVLLEVADTGPGFPPEDRDRFFLPYYSTKRSSGGLGLAIVHRIIVEHGGEIQIEDNVPRGARLIISLPALIPATV